MKTDLYTKAILTIIAIALITLVFQNFDVVPTATANTYPNKFDSGTIDVNVVSVNGHNIYGSSIDVEVTNTRDFQ